VPIRRRGYLPAEFPPPSVDFKNLFFLFKRNS